MYHYFRERVKVNFHSVAQKVYHYYYEDLKDTIFDEPGIFILDLL